MAITPVYTMTAGQTSFAVPDLRPGDVILWVWHGRKAGAITAPGAPSTILTIKDSENNPITWSIASSGPTFLDFSNSGGDDNYPNWMIRTIEGTTATELEVMYLIAYPVTGFTQGAYTLQFTLPAATILSRIAWGKVLRGVSLTHMGEAVQTFKLNVSQFDPYVDKPYRITGYIEDYPWPRSIEGGVYSPAYIVCFNHTVVLKSPQPTSYGTVGATFQTYSTQSIFMEVGTIANGSYTFQDPGTLAANPGPGYDDFAATSWLILRETGWEIPPAATVYFVDMLVFNAATGATINF
jgi:hypothetical protein